MSNCSGNIKSVTDAINSIPELVEAIRNLIQTPFGWIILIGILLWFAVNKDLFFFMKLKEKRERQRIDEIEKYLEKSDLVDETITEVLNDLRTCRYFKVATGIYAEKKLRDELVCLHDKTTVNVSWRTIRQALGFFAFSGEGQLKIKPITIWHRLGKYYNLAVGWFMLSMSAASLIMMGATASNSIGSALLLSFLSFIFMSIAAFSFVQNNPLNAAIKIRDEISKPIKGTEATGQNNNLEQNERQLT